MRIDIEVSDDEIRKAVVRDIASSIGWEMREQIKKRVESSIKVIDQATINRMVTEVLVAEHLGKLEGKK